MIIVTNSVHSFAIYLAIKIHWTKTLCVCLHWMLKYDLKNHPIKLAAFTFCIKLSGISRTKAFNSHWLLTCDAKLKKIKPTTEWGLFDQIDNIIEHQFKLITLDALFGQNGPSERFQLRFIYCGCWRLFLSAHCRSRWSSVKEPI